MSAQIAFEIETFKPVVSVTELWMKTLENTTKDFGVRVTQALAEKYGFSNDEAVKFLGLESVAINRKAMAKRSKSTKEPKEKKVKKVKEPKEEKMYLPFMRTMDDTLCHGISYNHGLFTQCSKKPLENHSFCKGCQAQADKNSDGRPDCGTIESRMFIPLFEYHDSKGRTPVAYSKIMKKYGYTLEQVEAKIGKPLNPEFLYEPEKKKTSGRPKKAADAVATSTDDIFNGLTAENGSEMGEETPKKKSAKLSEEEKAEKKAKLEAERAEAKRLRDEKEAVEKAEKAEKRKAELEAKKAEREAKKEAEKAEKEAKKAQEKAERAKEKAEKEALEKEAKKAQKSNKSSPVSPVTTETKAEEKKTEEPPKKKMGVVKIEIDGTTYYLNKETKIVYDPKTKEEVGTYDEDNKKLIPLPEEEDEEIAEEGYETD